MSDTTVSRDEEALAVVIGSAGRLGHVYIDGNDGCLAAARAVLASDWLADHDAAVLEEGVRLAMTWLAADYPYGDMPEWRQRGVEWISSQLADHTRTPEEGK